MQVRLAKVDRIRAAGGDPYPVGFPRTTTIAEIREEHPDLEPDTATGEKVGVTGRVVLSRIGGKLCFATIRDGTGDIQVMISQNRVGEPALAAWKSDVDLGDHIGVEGEVITSRSGELSVLADSYAITAKALRPLPEKHAGLNDPEARVRQRYLDLIINPEARRMAELRATVTRSLREELHARGFLEAETPVLQVLHGGANARPFVTHSNAYDIQLYLRIALELYLKRLVVGGIEKVYEIGRIFRNEGADATHNPEFTMLEAYEAYGDYTTIGTLTRELIQAAAVAGLGSTVVRRLDGSEHDIGGEWPWVGVHEAISRALGEEVTPDTSEETLRQLSEPGRHPPGTEVEPRPGSAGALRAPRRGADRGADLLSRLPGRGVAADPRAPDRPQARRALGPGRVRRGDRHWLQRAGGPGAGARAADSAVPARCRRGPGCDAARRGIPAGTGVRHAAEWWHGHGHRPAADPAHRGHDQGDDPVPDRPSGISVPVPAPAALITGDTSGIDL